MLYIEVISKLGKHIRITKKHWDYIVSKHESIMGLEEQIKETMKPIKIAYDERGRLDYFAIFFTMPLPPSAQYTLVELTADSVDLYQKARPDPHFPKIYHQFL